MGIRVTEYEVVMRRGEKAVTLRLTREMMLARVRQAVQEAVATRARAHIDVSGLVTFDILPVEREVAGD